MSDNDQKGNLQASEQGLQMDIQKILEYLPHRYPFLLVDRVTHCIPNQEIRAYKNISFNEAFFQGHFPNLPIMPGVLILEALAQAGALLAAASFQDNLQGKIFLFTGLDKVKFRKQVVPGDRLELHCSEMRMKLQLCKMNAVASVDGQVAAEAQITAALKAR